MHFVDKLLPHSPHRENFSELNRMMSGDFALPSSLTKKNMVSNRQGSAIKSSSWVPESEEHEEGAPRIPRLCMMKNKEDMDMEEAQYDTEMLILKSMTVSNQMKELHVNKWLKKHAVEKTQPFYLKTGRELWQELQLEKLFLSFDEDGSNSLDVKEMHEMFTINGVNITLDDCFKLFKFVDEDGSGALSVDEFKLFLKSEGANESKQD
jgi:hypothetical protein